MVKAFINIRIKQISRGLASLGIFRTLFLVVLIGFLGTYIFMLSSEMPNSMYVAGFSILIITLFHTNRSDKLFLKTHFNNFKLILFSEYLLVTLPIIICLSIHLQLIPTNIILFSLVVIVNLDLKFKQNNLNTKLQRIIPAESFEWKAGIRKIFYLFIILWFTGFFGSFFIGTVPIVIFILGIIPMSFYEKSEPFQMIISYELGSTRFLIQKIKTQFLLFSIISLPLIFAFLLFHHQNWYIPIIEYFTFISLHVYFILTKYAFYEPNSKTAASQIFSAIGAISAIIPIFLPLVWIMSVYFFFKSKNNLNYYLNDFNK